MELPAWYTRLFQPLDRDYQPQGAQKQCYGMKTESYLAVYGEFVFLLLIGRNGLVKTGKAYCPVFA